MVRWVTMHGTSLNASARTEPLSAIVPCGLHGERVTSIEHETGHRPELEDVARSYARRFGEIFAMSWEIGHAPSWPTPTAHQDERSVPHVQ